TKVLSIPIVPSQWVFLFFCCFLLEGGMLLKNVRFDAGRRRGMAKSPTAGLTNSGKSFIINHWGSVGYTAKADFCAAPYAGAGALK
ncbi:MAG: hypothetical protein RSC91_09465, partial [Clostridia bacterium]